MEPTHRWIVATPCAFLGGSCFASAPATPEPQTQGAVTYVTGGIGLDEAESIRAAAQQYNLRITFSSLAGAYFADVKVTLRDARGRTVIEVTSDGPFVFFSVLPGKYEVTAEHLGQTVTRVAQVRDKRGTELYIRWNLPPEAQPR